MYKTFSCVHGESGRFERGTHPVIEEASLSLNINGRHAMTAMVSPAEIEEFVTGFLFTEQIIKGIGEIESIKQDDGVVSVLTTNPFKVTGAKKIVLSGCGGTSSHVDPKKLPQIDSDFTLQYDAVTAGIRQVMDSELHKMTGGVHIVGLMGRDGLIHRSEDIGRHNAFDKVIGYALCKGIDLSRTFAISSGRISSEMVRKCLVSNIPVIASRGAATSLSLEVAEKTGLCVIGFVRGEKMNIYTHPERIEGTI